MTPVHQMTISELEHETVRCESALGETEKIAADLRARLNEVRAELAKRLRPSPEPKVSDHALLRYIERVVGIDIEYHRAQILTDNVKAALRAGASGLTVNGVKMVANNGVVVTVLAEEMRPKKKTQKGWKIIEDDGEYDAA